jgi:hypothetical protein
MKRPNKKLEKGKRKIFSSCKYSVTNFNWYLKGFKDSCLDEAQGNATLETKI